MPIKPKYFGCKCSDEVHGKHGCIKKKCYYDYGTNCDLYKCKNCRGYVVPPGKCKIYRCYKLKPAKKQLLCLRTGKFLNHCGDC